MGETPSKDLQVCVLVVEDDPALQRMILAYFGENNIRTLVGRVASRWELRRAGHHHYRASPQRDRSVVGLELGADDYLTKPFNLCE
jgi:DNA-binding response OmpR family regulator